jgi:hypothetical protein
MRASPLLMALTTLLLVSASASARTGGTAFPEHPIRFQHPTDFSLVDALVGAAAAGLLVGLTAAVAAWRAHKHDSRLRRRTTP